MLILHGQGDRASRASSFKRAFCKMPQTLICKNLMSSGRLLIVSDEHVARFYMDSLKQQLLEAGYQVASCVLEPGERSKRLSCVERIYEALYELRATRTDAVVAFGGGVIGDMAGFAAATYQRGICLVQIPTSLIQVDSSVGGKTAVDTDFGKNMVGAFYQPDLVLIDPETLSTPTGAYC